jgi:hypothetical protein
VSSLSNARDSVVLIGLIAAGALVGLLSLAWAIRRLRSGRFVAGTTGGAFSLVVLVAATSLGLLAGNLVTYQRLTHEEPALEVTFTRSGERLFDALLTYPAGERQRFVLRGDEWQIDARILKWHAFANILGFDAAYRFERISGRYNDVESERSAPRTVYPLASPDRIDAWELARRYRDWIPWIDAYYGSAAYLPMADGASFEVRVSQSGLTARPLNAAARQAIGSWR